MSNENLVQNTEVPISKRGKASRVAFILLIAVGLVSWLLYIESEISSIKSKISSIESELSIVGVIARNADSYAHSHYSDIRMKRNVANLDNALTNVLQLRAVTFNWDTSKFPNRGFSNETQIGLIAQEVKQVYPELVSVDENGYKMLDYANLTPILLEAIKEQQIAIDELQRQNADLVNRITELENATGTSK